MSRDTGSQTEARRTDGIASGQIISVQQRRRLERRSVLESITSNGTISACVMIAAAVAAVICANTDAYAAVHDWFMRPV